MTWRGFLAVILGVALAMLVLAGIAWLLWGSSKVAYGAVTAGEDPARWEILSTDRIGNIDIQVTCDTQRGQEVIFVEDTGGHWGAVAEGGACGRR